jgi:hypothetical protein
MAEGAQPEMAMATKAGISQSHVGFIHTPLPRPASLSLRMRFEWFDVGVPQQHTSYVRGVSENHLVPDVRVGGIVLC